MKNIKYRLANLLGLNTDASLFEINHDEIQKTNLLFLQQISFTSGLIMLLLYLVSLVLPSIADLRMTYFMEFLVSAIIFVLTCVAFDALLPYSLVLTYFLTSVIMAYGAIAGIYQTPEGTATAFIVLISFLPMLIFDKQSHVLPFSVVLWLLFCGATFMLKDFKYSSFDILNSSAGLLMGILINAKIFKIRISGINSSRILARQTQVDELTGLPNYKKLLEDLSGKNDTRIAKSLCSLAIIDIDMFKEYNTKYGREMGDKCLRKIGNCMLKISDPGELIVYRYGGTSLVAVSLIHDYKGIQRVCQGLSVLIKGLNIEFQGTEEEKITVSCGYTDVVECECDEFEKLLDMAGEALQQARKDGGNCSVGYLQVQALKEN